MAEALRIIPLGGLGEIGKNMMLFEYQNHILVVDVGIMFPEFDMLGIDLVLPDFTYLRDHADGGRGHHHHARPRGSHRRRCPTCWATCCPPTRRSMPRRSRLGLIRAKLSEHPALEGLDLRPVAAGGTVTVGPFEVEFLAITHSIPDGVGLAIKTPVGLVIHTGDFKFDYTPVRGSGPGFARLGQLGAQGVLGLAQRLDRLRAGGAYAVRVGDRARLRPDLPGGARPHHRRHLCVAAEPRPAGHRRGAAPRPGGRPCRLLHGEDDGDRAGAGPPGGAGGSPRGPERGARSCPTTRLRSSPPVRRASPKPRWPAWPRAPTGRSKSSRATPSSCRPRPIPGNEEEVSAADQQAHRTRRRAHLPAAGRGPRLGPRRARKS